MNQTENHTRQELEKRIFDHYSQRCISRQSDLFSFAVGVMSTDSLNTMIEVLKIPEFDETKNKWED